MSYDERKKLLEDHLQMLAERAKTANGFLLIALTDRMSEIAKMYKEKFSAYEKYVYGHIIGSIKEV